ncbi:hypothetical protein SISNIDRAFT_359357 [Sistotremastrum niveocremeum HHB9708]|uniref:DUF6533 domain-containing protein n=1 Tax=Sistotremastrum niveocremeum HHB9708 TaxID=1314777 RepID=A0A164WMJ2_9AGAM|nr:hypothetical protein SISNIDRAFT_359357 [Sistotremastrum niveocremeum HHB9708]
MPPIGATLIHELVSALQNYNIAQQTKVAGLTMLLYDWMLTFNLELKYIWGKSFSIPKVLYLISRWLPVIGIAFSIAVQSLPRPSTKVPLLDLLLDGWNTNGRNAFRPVNSDLSSICNLQLQSTSIVVSIGSILFHFHGFGGHDYRAD